MYRSCSEPGRAAPKMGLVAGFSVRHGPARIGCFAALLWGAAFVLAASVRAVEPKPDLTQVPGVVIDHLPASSGLYVGSPGLAILPDGRYVASHDFFGPKSTEHQSARTAVFGSSDRGQTWTKLAEIDGQFWSTLFVHRGALYLMGTNAHYGQAIIRRSEDGGRTWTTPRDKTSGLLLTDGHFHCAPVPVVEHNGRLWRAMEDILPTKRWGRDFRAFMMSAPADADLLRAESWTSTNRLPRDPAWLGGQFNGWLEGNAVVTREGQVLDILRVDTPGYPEKAALVTVSPDGRTAAFDPESGFIDFPGGAKKFTIRYDPASDLYWTLATIVPERYQGRGRPGGVRNTLALTSSPDLRTWTVRSIVLEHPDTLKHGFQYVDWLFDGDDLIAACRTAFDDGLGGAHNNHDANLLTFHRIAGFRRAGNRRTKRLHRAARPPTCKNAAVAEQKATAMSCP